MNLSPHLAGAQEFTDQKGTTIHYCNNIRLGSHRHWFAEHSLDHSKTCQNKPVALTSIYLACTFQSPLQITLYKIRDHWMTDFTDLTYLSKILYRLVNTLYGSIRLDEGVCSSKFMPTLPECSC